MKECPNCHRNYSDDSLRFCLEDGSQLATVTQIVESPPPTMRVEARRGKGPPPTEVMHHELPSAPQPVTRLSSLPWLIAGGALFLVFIMGLIIGVVVLVNMSTSSNRDSIATNKSSSGATPTPSPRNFTTISSLVDTTWAGTDSNGAYYEFTYLSTGKFDYKTRRADQSQLSTFSGGQYTWQQTGNSLVMDFNNGYARYDGVIANDRIEYRASNKTNTKWTGSLSRIK